MERTKGICRCAGGTRVALTESPCRAHCEVASDSRYSAVSLRSAGFMRPLDTPALTGLSYPFGFGTFPSSSEVSRLSATTSGVPGPTPQAVTTQAKRECGPYHATTGQSHHTPPEVAPLQPLSSLKETLSGILPLRGFFRTFSRSMTQVCSDPAQPARRSRTLRSQTSYRVIQY